MVDTFLEPDASDEKNVVKQVKEEDAANNLAERNGGNTDRDSQLHTEREKNRQIELIEQVHSQFRVAGAKFYFKDQPGKVAMKDKGERMVSASNDDRVAKAMATMAEAKGWKTIKISGHPEFRREVWLEASVRGIKTRGYKPTEQDLKLLEQRRERTMRNMVEHDTTRTRNHQRQADGHKTVSARNNPPVEATKGDSKEPDREVKTAAKAAVRAYKGTVLEQRGIAKGKVKNGDDVKLEYKGRKLVTVDALKRDKTGQVIGEEKITTNRNKWNVQKSEKAQVVEAVASAFIDAKVKDPTQREALKAAVGVRMTERERTNKVPVIAVYDKAAPSHAQQPERTDPVVERNAERVR